MSMLNEKWANDAISEYREAFPEDWAELERKYSNETELKFTALLIKARKDKKQVVALQIKQEAFAAGIVLY